MDGILVADKSAGWTSFDVVAKLRGVLKERKIGHGGTLDPMATGVLPLFLGRATKTVSLCETFDKEYIAGIRLGVVTDTQDTTGTIIEERPVAIVESDILAALSRFRGELWQTPPMYSAVKIGGERLYRIARRGGEVERPPRRVTISELELQGGGGNEYTLRAVCSKGTYIRTLCHDIGEALGCGAAMCSLRRTRVGVFHIEEALTIDEIIQCAENGTILGCIKPADYLVKE